MLISNVLHECDSVALFKIPPGEASLSKWTPKVVVWRGSLRLIEEEQTSVSGASAPHSGLRLKLELYNQKSKDILSEHFGFANQKVTWAEVWYNPFSETSLDYKIGNDGTDTIKMCPDSYKYYRVVAQLPDTGYYPIPKAEKGSLLQVALGLQLDDLTSASSFSESLAIYKRHFRNFQERFLYEDHLSDLKQKMQVGLSFPSSDSKDSVSDFEDEDFGNFVSTTYD